MSQAYEDLLPPVTELNRPFWEGCRLGQLRLPKCDSCGTFWFPESALCPSCLSDRYQWVAASGRGTVWSWIVMHQRYFPALAAKLPYRVLFVQLDEGPFMMSAPADEAEPLECGTPLEAVFPEVVPGRRIVKFRGRKEAGDE